MPSFLLVVAPYSLDGEVPAIDIWTRKDGTVYRAPVVRGRRELSPKYMKVVLRQLGFTDEEIDTLL